MTEKSEVPQIYTALNACMKDMEAIAKNRKNSAQNYNFRGIDDVFNAAHPVLAKHGVIVVPSVESIQRESGTTKSGGSMMYTVVTVNHRFYAKDGSFVEARTIGEGMDSGDKSSNKAMSAAYKYAMFETLCIPTEMIDSEEDEPEKPKTPEEIERENLLNYIRGAYKNTPDIYKKAMAEVKAKSPVDLDNEGLKTLKRLIKIAEDEGETNNG